MSKVAFLGAGNMAAAMVDGLLATGVPAASLACFTASGKSAAALAARTGIRHARSLDELLADADTLVVAFKPQHLVLAGKNLATLAKTFPRARAVVRTMPNTPGAIGAGVTGWCVRGPLAVADRALVEKLLGALGIAIEIPEEQMDALTAVSGSGPAYVFEFAAALRDAAVAAGLAPDVAQKLSVETLLGAARLLARKNIEPEKLRDAVTSPNGVTFAGLQRMAARDFRGLVRETVFAAKARAEELSKDS